MIDDAKGDGPARGAVFRIDHHRDAGHSSRGSDRAPRRRRARRRCAARWCGRDNPRRTSRAHSPGISGVIAASATENASAATDNFRLPQFRRLRLAVEPLAVGQLSVRELDLHPHRHVDRACIDCAGGRGSAAFQSVQENVLGAHAPDRTVGAGMKRDAVLGMQIVGRRRILHADGHEDVLLDETLPTSRRKPLRPARRRRCRGCCRRRSVSRKPVAGFRKRSAWTMSARERVVDGTISRSPSPSPRPLRWVSRSRTVMCAVA